MQMTSSKESGAPVERALADAARAAHAPDASEAHQKALVKAMAAAVKALTSRVEFAETAFMSMLNDLDEAPDPAPSLAAAADAAAYVSSATDAAATSARRLETARAKLAAADESAAANASAAAELAALRAAFDDKVEAIARERLADAEARARRPRRRRRKPPAAPPRERNPTPRRRDETSTPRAPECSTSRRRAPRTSLARPRRRRRRRRPRRRARGDARRRRSASANVCVERRDAFANVWRARPGRRFAGVTNRVRKLLTLSTEVRSYAA